MHSRLQRKRLARKLRKDERRRVDVRAVVLQAAKDLGREGSHRCIQFVVCLWRAQDETNLAGRVGRHGSDGVLDNREESTAERDDLADCF